MVTPTQEAVGETAGAASAGRFFERADWFSFGVTASMAFGIYLLTLAPDVTLENAGGLAPAAMYGGVAYPPGFPAWTIYSWLFIKLIPFGTIAWRIGVGSAVAAAIMSGLVALMVSRGGLMLMDGWNLFASWRQAEQQRLRIICGWVAGMAVGLSLPIWRSAVIVDIWTFGDLLFVLVLCLLTRWSFDPSRRRHFYWAMFLFGLALTGNWEFVLSLFGILFMATIVDARFGRDLTVGVIIAGVTGWRFIVAPYLFSRWNVIYNTPLVFALAATVLLAAATTVYLRKFGSEWRAVLGSLGVLTLGPAAWLWLPVGSMMNPPVNWAYPRTVEGFLHSVQRGQYDSLHTANDLVRMAKVVWWEFKDAGGGLGWIYLAPAVIPFLCLWRLNGTAKRLVLSLGAILLCAGPFLITTLNLGDDKQTLDYVRPYYGAMYVVLAILSGLGFVVVGGLSVRLPVYWKKCHGSNEAHSLQ